MRIIRPERSGALPTEAGPVARARRSVSVGRRRVAPLDAATLTLLAELVASGATVGEALVALEEVVRVEATRGALHAARDDVMSGAPLASAMAHLARPHIVAIVAGAEQVGRLADGLAAAADLAGRLEHVARSVRRALVYPGVVLGVALIVLLVFATVIVPPLESTFRNLGGDLPLATRLVLQVAAVVRSPPALLGPALMVVAVRLVSRRTGRGAALLARTVARIPMVGPIRRDIDVVVATRVIATLLASGGTLLSALEVAASSVRDRRVRERLEAAADGVSRGVGSAHEGGVAALLDPIERSMVLVAERQGLLAQQWGRVAERRLRGLESRLERLASLVEPLLVVLVGLATGGMVAALYLPSFRVLQLI